MAKPDKPAHKRYTFVVAKEHGVLTADTQAKVFKARVKTRVERVEYLNPAGLPADVANYFAVSLRKTGAVVVADGVSSQSPSAITANAFLVMTNGTRAARTLAAGDELELFPDETGTASLPAGTVLVYLTELTEV